METIKILQGAFELMGSESLTCDVETGGLLIGTLKNPIVFKATKAGINAIKSYASYTNDADHDNEILKQSVDESNGRLKLLGFWHKHPFGYDKPSLIDLDVARGIIGRSVKSGDSRKYYFIITNIEHGEVVNHNCYVFDPEENGFKKIEFSLAHDDDVMVKEVLQAEPTIPIAGNLDYWNDDGFSFHLTPKGNERLFNEIQNLKKNGYGVRVYQGKRIQMLIEGKVNIICHLPPEYPLNPPRFYYGIYEMSYPLHVWNSTMTIIDLLEKIQKNIGKKGRIYESNNHETKPRTITVFGRIKRAIANLWTRPRK